MSRYKISKREAIDFREGNYICPSCGGLSTFSQQLEEASQGGLPYCYCEFGGERGRIFIGYKRINKKLWERLKDCKTDKLRLKKYLEYKIKHRRKDNGE